MKFNKELFIETYKKKGCNISATCRAIGISRAQFYVRREEDPTIAEALRDAEEAIIDNAESKLLSKINEGDTVSLLFFLKTKGKKRGYVEKQEIEHSESESQVVLFELPDNNRDS